MAIDASPFKTAFSAAFGGLILGVVLAVAGTLSKLGTESDVSETVQTETEAPVKTTRRDEDRIRILKQRIAACEEQLATNRFAEKASAEMPPEPMKRYLARMPDGTEAEIGVLEISAIGTYRERMKNDPAFASRQRDLRDRVRAKNEEALEARLGRLEGSDYSAFTEEDEAALADWLGLLPRQLELDAGRNAFSDLSDEERRENGALAFEVDEACRALQAQVGDAFVRSILKRNGMDGPSAALVLGTIRRLYEQTKR